MVAGLVSNISAKHLILGYFYFSKEDTPTFSPTLLEQGAAKSTAGGLATPSP
jgi:hypothetical protein